MLFSQNVRDGDINFILERYKLDMEYEDAYGYDIAEVEEFIAQGKENFLIESLIEKFKKLEEQYDFVLCEGIRKSFLTTTISHDLNIKIAQNFGSPYINIVNAKEKTASEIYKEVLIENDYLRTMGSQHFATFINRVSQENFAPLQKMLQKHHTQVIYSQR